MAEIFLEWRDHNGNINYPFSDLATMRNSGNVALSRGVFVDGSLYPIGGDETLYLSRIEVTDSEMRVYLSTVAAGELAVGVFTVGGAQDNIVFQDQYGRPAGILVSSNDRLRLLPSFYGKGNFVFAPGDSMFAPSVVVPMPQAGLRGLLLDDGNIVAGDIYLVGADGVVLSLENGSIRVDIVGDPYAVYKACQAELIGIPFFCGIKTLNGVAPDDYGNFKLSIGGNVALDNVLRLEEGDNALQLKAAGTIGFQGNG